MGAFRWLLLGAGVLFLVGVFWWSRREASGKSFPRPSLLRRSAHSLAQDESRLSTGAVSEATPVRAPSQPHRIIAVRLSAPVSGTFAGEALQAALDDAGLRHGVYGIFHRFHPPDSGSIRFSVASLVEPGRFDLEKMTSERFPGITLFFPVVPGADNVSAFDDMMATARKVASRLDGELLDERGSRLSLQRERYLREEVIQMTRQSATAAG